MPEDQMQGTVRNIGGRVEEGFGKVVGDSKTEAQGLIKQAAGAAQEAYGKTVDATVEGAQTVKDLAVAGHDALKQFMEDNPHTTTAIALGIGLLIGYAAHRPPPRRGRWD
jgi:ElaB/YqjD/DUF883 family membrane-anchored ribosome-binding protein